MHATYYSHGSITGTVIIFDKFKGSGLLDVNGYWYNVQAKSRHQGLKYALYHKAKKNHPLTLKFWPTSPFPELLSHPIRLKVTRFTEAQNIDYVNILGIVHQSYPDGCVLRIPSIPRNKDYYSLVVTTETFEPGVCVQVEGTLDRGRIRARAISISD